MLVLMISAVVILYTALARYAGSGNRSRAARSSQAKQPVCTDIAGDSVMEMLDADADMVRIRWTALDDLQLNRLLRESS
jgi:hypothetical protein